ISIVIAAAAGWHQDRRTLILTAAGCYTLCWVITLLFFIPGVIAFNKVDVNGPPSPELNAKGRTWMRRSWPRHALMAAAATLALLALAGYQQAQASDTDPQVISTETMKPGKEDMSSDQAGRRRVVANITPSLARSTQRAGRPRGSPRGRAHHSRWQVLGAAPGPRPACGPAAGTGGAAAP